MNITQILLVVFGPGAILGAILGTIATIHEIACDNSNSPTSRIRNISDVWKISLLVIGAPITIVTLTLIGLTKLVNSVKFRFRFPVIGLPSWFVSSYEFIRGFIGYYFGIRTKIIPHHKIGDDLLINSFDYDAFQIAEINGWKHIENGIYELGPTQNNPVRNARTLAILGGCNIHAYPSNAHTTYIDNRAFLLYIG